MEILSGYKTYLAATALVLYGVFGALTGKVEPALALQAILEGLAIAGLRKGMSKS